MKIISVSGSEFQFRKYINLILSVVPGRDTAGISKIRITDNFSHKKCLDSLACYIPDQRGRNCVIEINIVSLSEKKIPKYLFDSYPEIAALFLSEVLTHEIGHHVHTFKRHGIKKNRHEEFADRYAVSGYYHYLRLRLAEILSSYRRASWNIYKFDKDDRKKFSSARKELIEWLKENKNGIPFP